jgi:hypothetical protein
MVITEPGILVLKTRTLLRVPHTSQGICKILHDYSLYISLNISVHLCLSVEIYHFWRMKAAIMEVRGSSPHSQKIIMWHVLDEFSPDLHTPST